MFISWNVAAELAKHFSILKKGLPAPPLLHADLLLEFAHVADLQEATQPLEVITSHFNHWYMYLPTQLKKIYLF